MEELRNCPFCGGEANIKVNANVLNASITCTSCNVTMKKSFRGDRRIKELLEELATKAWNRRVE